MKAVQLIGIKIIFARHSADKTDKNQKENLRTKGGRTKKKLSWQIETVIKANTRQIQQ